MKRKHHRGNSPCFETLPGLKRTETHGFQDHFLPDEKTLSKQKIKGVFTSEAGGTSNMTGDVFLLTVCLNIQISLNMKKHL